MKNLNFKGFNYETSSLITFDGVEVPFDRKNVLHVMYLKMFLLMDAVVMLNSGISSIENGATISEISTDTNDQDNLETYWLDSYFTDDTTGINSAKHDQLSLQVDADGNWC